MFTVGAPRDNKWRCSAVTTSRRHNVSAYPYVHARGGYAMFSNVMASLPVREVTANVLF